MFERLPAHTDRSKSRQVQPGWYDDPGGARQRWWNGRGWTDRTRPSDWSDFADDLSDPNRPRIGGLILSVTGISGLTTGNCCLTFEHDSATLMIGKKSNHMRLCYSDIILLQIGGRGDVVTTSGGGWSGGAIFPAGDIKNTANALFWSAAVSTVLNKLTTVKTHNIETIFHLTWQSGGVTFLNTAQLPAVWASQLSWVFQRIDAKNSQMSITAAAVSAATEKECPYCAETIKIAAIKCRYCGSDLA